MTNSTHRQLWLSLGYVSLNMFTPRYYLKKDFLSQVWKQNNGFYGQRLAWSSNPVRLTRPETWIRSKGLYPVREPAFSIRDDSFSKRTLVANWNRYFISALASVSLAGTLYVLSLSQNAAPDPAFALKEWEGMARAAGQEESQLKKADTSMASTLYRIYNNKGKMIDLNSLVNALNNREIILIGETHEDSVAHQLELTIVQYLYQNMKNSGNGNN